MRFSLSVLLLLSWLTDVSPYNIVLFNPLNSHSHYSHMLSIADVLHDAGHNVTMVIPIIKADLMDSLKLPKTSHVIFIDQDPRVSELSEIRKMEKKTKLWDIHPNPLAMLALGKTMTMAFTYTCESLLNNATFMNFITTEKFDLGIAEPFNFCGFGLLEVAQTPAVVGVSSTVQFDVVSYSIGEPLAPSYVPVLLGDTPGDKMTFFQRLSNVIGMMFGYHFFARTFTAERNCFVEKYGSFRTFEDILSDMSFHFTNANPYLNFPRPILHKNIDIGGITIDREALAKQKLDEKWDRILSQRKHTVLISFGSVAKSIQMPEEYQKSIIETVKSMPDVTFIWKYEDKNTTIGYGISNLYLDTWLPQQALLNDDRLSLFVTHGGLGSTTELAHLGKPAVFIPLFAEQPRNARMLARHGGAIVLQKTDLGNMQVLKDTSSKILYEESYRFNAKRLADILNNQPIPVKENFLRHIEFAARYGRINNLTPAGRDLNIFQYYLVDVALFIFASVFTILFVVYKIVCCCCCSKRRVKTKED